jgi:hypothetical protein
VSAASQAAFQNLSKARAMLMQLVPRLRGAASGQVVDRAAAKVQEQIDKVGRKYTEQHKLSGDAAATLNVTRDGGLVLLKANRYLDYHDWWPFRRGMPPFVINHAVKVLQAELVAALTGKPSPLLTADAEAEERAAVKAAKAAARSARVLAKFKRDTARIARREERHRKRVERERKREERERKRDRAYNERVRAREDRE